MDDWMVGAQDQALLEISGGKKVDEANLRRLPPWRASMIADVAVRARAMPAKDRDAIRAEAAEVGGTGVLVGGSRICYLEEGEGTEVHPLEGVICAHCHQAEIDQTRALVDQMMRQRDEVRIALQELLVSFMAYRGIPEGVGLTSEQQARYTQPVVDAVNLAKALI